ncbi:MAG: response regulator [Bacteroidota bacterium]
MGRGFFLILSFIWGVAVFADNAKQRDSLLAKLSSENKLETRVDLYNQISSLSLDMPEMVIQNSLKAIELANNSTYEKGLNEAYLYLGIGFCESSNYDSAIIYLNKALIHFQQYKTTPKNIIRANNYLGIAYEYRTNYTKALYYYYQSYNAASAIGDSTYILKSVNNIGLVYYAMDNYKLAEKFLLMAYKLAISIKSELSLMEYNLATLYLAQKKFALALEKYKKVLVDDLQSGNQKNIAECYNNIGACYLGLNDLKSAEAFLSKGFEIREKINDENGLRNSFVDLADLNIQNGHYNEALILLEKALYIAQKTKNKKGIVSIYDKYIECYKTQNNLKQALNYTELKDAILQEISDAEGQIKLKDLQTESLMRQKAAEKEVATAKKENQSLVSTFLIIISIVLIVGFIFLTFSFLKIRNQNRLLLASQKQLASKNNALHAQNEQILKSQLQAQQALKVKSDFTSTISHEVRTPLNAINGVCELLLNSDISPEHIENINLMKISSDKLIRLINDILDFSRLENGNSEFNLTEFRLNQILKGLVDLFVVKTNDKKIELILDYDFTENAIYKSDSLRLTQVLGNLLSNAVKFTSTGYIKLVAYPLQKGNFKTTYRFEVIDTGVGIPANKQRDIFEAFLQIDNSSTRRVEGAGLGLSICQKIIEAFGSQLHVESEVGKGSRFYFDLDFEVVQSNNVLEIQKVDPINVSLENCNVLVVEDTTINVMILKQFLKKWKCNFDVADNGISGIQKIKDNRYDIVLMDIQMPEMDGIECTKAIRLMDKPYYKQLPIIAITAANESMLRNAAYQAGMNDYVLKPFNPDELKEKMLRAIYNFSSLQKL